MTTPMPTTTDHAERRDAVAGRIGAAILGALDAQAIYLGDRLGLYRALADGGPATAPELAERAGIHRRYAREWLEHQAVGAILVVDDVAAAPDDRRYTLPAAHVDVLVDEDNLAYLAPLSRMVVGTAQRLPDVLAAYRTGGGVDWADYGPDVVEAQEGINRPQFAHLVGDWIDGLPDIAARLREGGGRVADVACGTGWSSISIARHFPKVAVDGIDIDAGLHRARQAARRGDGADRPRLVPVRRRGRRPTGLDATTLSRSSRRSTTWPAQSRCWQPRAGSWRQAVLS